MIALEALGFIFAVEKGEGEGGLQQVALKRGGEHAGLALAPRKSGAPMYFIAVLGE